MYYTNYYGESRENDYDIAIVMVNTPLLIASLIFHGTTGEMENETNSSLTFEGITIQAFTKNGLLSPGMVVLAITIRN